MPQYKINAQGKKAGCIRRTFFGCSALFFIFTAIVVLILISIELPEIKLSEVKKSNYDIVVDSLTNEKVINASFSWRYVDNSMRRRRYDLSFRLLEEEVKDAMTQIEMISKMSYKELGVQSRFSDPVLEARIVWAEVYRRVYNYSIPQMKSILEGFNQIFIDEKFNSKDRVIFVITFVQNIPYERPGGVLDLFPPLGTLAYRYGDCDSKAILLYVILERMGLDCAMLWSYKYKHAMLGVAVTGSGVNKTFNGKRYFFLETTYPGWNIGELPPEFKNKRFWFIDEIDSNQRIESDEDKDLKRRNEDKSNRDVKPSPATQ